MPAPALPLSAAASVRLEGRPLLLLLDVDGTLSPIAPRPEYAVVPPETQRLVERLAATPNLHVAVVSGRAADDARRIVGVSGVWVIGNHGIETAAPNEAPKARDDVVAFADRIALAADRASAISESIQGIIVENKRWSLSVHYRLAHPRIVPDLTSQVEIIAADLGLRVTRGKEVLEIRPPVEVDKGTAAVALADRLGALHDEASIFAAGDDRTDEDMFRSLRGRKPRAVTVHVGVDPNARETVAEFSVADTDAMRELLGCVLALREGL
ncbi:MAG TPA: trehalose-phosphatase [Gemmatimonadaceae bacterium]|jgi:trehalose-phosphatase|nr:trehalose-phosphatase [Gemmatimonadaceae bacterium]